LVSIEITDSVNPKKAPHKPPRIKGLLLLTLKIINGNKVFKKFWKSTRMKENKNTQRAKFGKEAILTTSVFEKKNIMALKTPKTIERKLVDENFKLG